MGGTGSTKPRNLSQSTPKLGAKKLTTLYVALDSVDRSSIAKRVDIWRESQSGIGRFEVILDNTGNALTGLTSQDAVELRIDTVSLLKGYVDNYVPMIRRRGAIYYEEALVTGRDYGQDLANLMLEKDYYDDEIDDIIDDALSTTSSEITYTSGTALAKKDVSFKNNYLQTKFLEIVKLVNADFYVDDNKALQLFALSSATSSGVTLSAVAGSATNNILLLPQIGAAVGFDLRNYILIEAGYINDHWTDLNASDYTNTNDCTVADETTTYVPGGGSIKATSTTNGAGQYFLTPITEAKYGRSDLDFTFQSLGEDSMDCDCLLRHDFAGNIWIAVRMIDDGSREIEYYKELLTPNVWHRITFPVGEGNTADIIAVHVAQENVWVGNSSFSWVVEEIGVYCEDAITIGDIIYFDGLHIPKYTARAIREDATSQAAYRERRIRLSRPDLKNQRQIDDVAVDELAKRKDPLQTLKLTAIGNTSLHYAGQTLVVNAPTSGISSVTNRIVKLHHAAEPGFNLCKGYDFITELDLITHASPYGIDPVRLKLSGTSAQSNQAQLQRLNMKVNALERA